jgi:hypothetical protein
MQHSDAESPEVNPYAPPRAQVTPTDDDAENEQLRIQRRRYFTRESCIRATGLVCFAVAVIALLVFLLGTLSEYRKASSDELDIEQWMYRRWVARMATINSLAFIATVTSWGLFRLRNWGRWAVTIVSLFPTPILLCYWLFGDHTGDPAVRESLNSVGLIALMITSVLSFIPQLYFLWSPKGRMVFSPGYRSIILLTPDQRGGCLGFLQAFLFFPAICTSYLVLMMTTLNSLVILGLIRSF